ncbi:unnamed protein product, partial [Cylicocyclus nassatus]
MGIRLSTANRRKLANTTGTSPFPTSREKKTSKIKSSPKTPQQNASNEEHKLSQDPVQKTLEERTQKSSSSMMGRVKGSLGKTRKFRSFSSKSKNFLVKPLKPLKATGPVNEHTFGELRLPNEAHPKRTKPVQQELENTRAEKPRRRPKFQKQSKQLKEMMENRRSEEERKPSKEEVKKEVKIAKKEAKKDSSVYLQALLNESETAIEHSPSPLHTACEEKALITEAVNKPPPKIEDFFEMANPFDNECEDVSDTIFDVANDFPDLFLNKKALTRHSLTRTKTMNVCEPTQTCADVKGLRDEAK